MSILYVDTEHEKILRDDALAPAHRGKVERALARLSDAAGEAASCIHFRDVSFRTLEQLSPTAVVLSGSTTDWAEYNFDDFEGLFEIVRAAPAPILGICAGHQLIGYAYGARWGPLGVLQEGETDPDPNFGRGQRKESGFLSISINPDCSLFRELGESATFFQSHYWQLEEIPAGFIARASSRWSPIQTIEHLEQPVFGVQFHPENFDDAHPDGETVLRNFFARARSR